jgi:alginate O-acetyltransferase complex protein AlgI
VRFNSPVFACFFIIVNAFNLAAMQRLRAQDRTLLAARRLFCGRWDWRFLGLLLASTTLDHLCALRIERVAGRSGTRRLVLSSIVAGSSDG